MRTRCPALPLALAWVLFSAAPRALATGVTLTAPTNNAAIDGPTNITLAASTTGGPIAQVQFFQGTNSLGVSTTAPYTLMWANTNSGPFALTAVATDNSFLTYTSAVASIIVAPGADALRNRGQPIAGVVPTISSKVSEAASRYRRSWLNGEGLSLIIPNASTHGPPTSRAVLVNLDPTAPSPTVGLPTELDARPLPALSYHYLLPAGPM